MTIHEVGSDRRELLPEELGAKLPGMGSSPETQLVDSVVHLRFHDPANRWKWYVIEFDGEGTFFGLVVNPVGVVAGQFKLAELEGLQFDNSPGEGLRVMRDLQFRSLTVGELAEVEPGIGEFLADQTPLARLE